LRAKAAHPRQGAADRGEYRQAAGASAEAIKAGIQWPPVIC